MDFRARSSYHRRCERSKWAIRIRMSSVWPDERGGSPGLKHRRCLMAMQDVPSILAAIEGGDQSAPEILLPLVYDELRKLAAAALAREKPGQTLQATALVHEAYVRLVGAGPERRGWNGRNHFLAAAAEAMRRILIENARRKQTEKRGGGLRRIDIDGVDSPADPAGASPEDLISLDEALTRLAEEDPAKAQLVKLRYFGGLSIEEAAALLGISRATAARYWDYARSWLYQALRDSAIDESRSEK
jgi:RNA polymerase sigma factor (TIGR02999 family)